MWRVNKAFRVKSQIWHLKRTGILVFNIPSRSCCHLFFKMRNTYNIIGLLASSTQIQWWMLNVSKWCNWFIRDNQHNKAWHSDLASCCWLRSVTDTSMVNNVISQPIGQHYNHQFLTIVNTTGHFMTNEILTTDWHSLIQSPAGWPFLMKENIYKIKWELRG